MGGEKKSLTWDRFCGGDKLMFSLKGNVRIYDYLNNRIVLGYKMSIDKVKEWYERARRIL